MENQEGQRVAVTPRVIVSSPATLSICPILQEVLTHQPHLLGPLRGPLSLGVRSLSFRLTLLIILPAPSECPGPQCPHYPTHLQPLPAEICGQAPAFLLPLWPVTSNPLPSGSPPQPPSAQPPINTECYLQNECRPPEGLPLRKAAQPRNPGGKGVHCHPHLILQGRAPAGQALCSIRRRL